MANTTKLPPPRRVGAISLETCLERRRSIRSFTEEPLSLEHISQLLWAGQGMSGSEGLRTAPSAGARYPVELYLVLADGVFHYEPGSHTITLVHAGDVRHRLYGATGEQEAVLEAPATLVFAVIEARTQSRYGRQRGERYVHLDVGHAAQNVLLQTVALSLGAVPVGAFEDDEVHQILGLPKEQKVLYMVPVGHPK